MAAERVDSVQTLNFETYNLSVLKPTLLSKFSSCVLVLASSLESRVYTLD